MTSLLTDLKAYYKFQGNGVDSSGSGNDATVLNVSFGNAYGKIDQGGSFNGTTSRFTKNASSMLTGTNPTSVSGWVRIVNNTGNFPCPINLGSTNGTNSAFNFYIDPSNVIGLGTFTVGIPGSFIGDGNFHQVCGTYDGATSVKLYIDGVYVNGASITMNWLDSNIRIGYLDNNDGPDDDQYFTGDVDEVGYWQRELTSFEVFDLYNYGMGLTYPFTPTLLTGLKLYWNMEGNGNDVSGNGNNATTVVGATFSLAYGKVNQGVNLVGGGGLAVSTTNIGTGAPPLTMACWINCPPGIGGNFPVIFNYGQFPSSPNAWLLAFMVPSGQIIYSMYGNDVNGPIIDDGNWHFVVITYDGNVSGQMFVDNVSYGTTTAGAPVNITLQDIQFGNNNLTQTFVNNMDEFGVWRRVLTPTEITTLYNAGVGLTYPFLPPVSTTNASLLFNLL